MNYNEALVNVQAYLPNDKEIIKIIEICSLTPIEGSWRIWTDNGGHLLIIKKNRKVIARRILSDNLIIKDLYHKSSAKQISKTSKFAMFSIAKTKEDSTTNICYIWFLGNDNKLRLLCFLKNEWVDNQMPLGCGLKTLRFLVRHLDIENYKAVRGHRSIKGTYTGTVEKSWLTKWEPKRTLLLDMLLTSRNMMNRILTDCGVLNDKKSN
jgi:hypothetical protein